MLPGHAVSRLLVEPGSTVRLADLDPRDTLGLEKPDDVDDALEESIELLADYQARLAAQGTHALLVVLQAMDAAGKDGAIKHAMSGVNPQGVQVTSFKAPAGVELEHDYLWRHVVALPERGKIGIFNRSHYEEVLVVRVHPEILEGQRLPPELVGDGIWQRRFGQINAFERHLAENGTSVVKIFLNVSKQEQRERFLARIEEPEKHWKFQARDVRERAYWDDYMRAYEEALSATSTEWAPWYVVPADRKWFARLAVTAIVTDALRRIDPEYPVVDGEARRALIEAKELLEREEAG